MDEDPSYSPDEMGAACGAGETEAYNFEDSCGEKL
jgi:hypothetical protein